MSNIYYSPEAHGLTVVKDVEWKVKADDFCMTALWRDNAGSFWAATDSGCSCPSPFEGETLSTLARINSFADLTAHVRQASEVHHFDFDGTPQFADLVSAYSKARA